MAEATEQQAAAPGLRARLDSEARTTWRKHDAYQNSLTGLGTYQRDKRVHAHSVVHEMSYEQCAELYRSNDIAGRIADDLPDEMCRKGWTLAIAGAGGREAGEKTAKVLEALEPKKQLRQCLRWARAFGGSALFVGANDGQTADQPLDETAIKSIDFLLPLDTLELVPDSYYGDPLHPKYGLPQTYRLNRFGAGVLPNTFGAASIKGGTGALEQALSLLKPRNGQSAWATMPIVHETRLIRFEGVFINRLQLRGNRYWPDSVFVRCNQVIRDFNTSWDAAAVLLQDFAQAVVKMKGYTELLTKEGPAAIAEVAAMIDLKRSSLGLLLLDADDEFERKATPVTGLPDLLDRFAQRLAAAAGMPVTRLMGMSPAGLNATGEQDGSNWDDKVSGAQDSDLRPALTRLLRLTFLAKAGPTNGKEPANWSFSFVPLKELSPTEEATRRYNIAQADDIYVKNGTVAPEEVAATRFGGDEYNDGKIQLIEADPEKRALAAQENAEAEAANAAEAAKPDPEEPAKDPAK